MHTCAVTPCYCSMLGRALKAPQAVESLEPQCWYNTGKTNTSFGDCFGKDQRDRHVSLFYTNLGIALV